VASAWDGSRAYRGRILFLHRLSPVRESILYAPSVPGWISVGMFVLIGVARYAIGMRDRERDAGKARGTP
jgi:hypothetical protein